MTFVNRTSQTIYIPTPPPAPVPSARLHVTDPAWIRWILDRQHNGFTFYKVDVTFASSGRSERADHWLRYFDDRVIFKIQKMIGRRRRVYSHLREYEFGIKSRKRITNDRRCPHHVHAIIGVRSKWAHRMTTGRLKKDIESLAAVSSVYIDLIPDDDSNPTKTLRAAYAYMRKGKTHRPLGAD